MQGCSPIPGAASSGQAPISAPARPKPTGRWQDAWGSVAHSNATSWVGVATGESSKAAAEKIALQKCGLEGAKDCSILMSYYDQSFAWVVPVAKVKGSRSGVGSGEGRAGNCNTDSQ